MDKGIGDKLSNRLFRIFIFFLSFGPFDLGDGSNIFQNKEPVRIFKIQPKEPLGGGPGGLIFDPKEMKIMLEKGEIAFSEFVASLPNGTIT